MHARVTCSRAYASTNLLRCRMEGRGLTMTRPSVVEWEIYNTMSCKWPLGPCRGAELEL